jgi:hypothetical protein
MHLPQRKTLPADASDHSLSFRVVDGPVPNDRPALRRYSIKCSTTEPMIVHVRQVDERIEVARDRVVTLHVARGWSVAVVLIRCARVNYVVMDLASAAVLTGGNART